MATIDTGVSEDIELRPKGRVASTLSDPYLRANGTVVFALIICLVIFTALIVAGMAD